MLWHLTGDGIYGILLFICGFLANMVRNYRRERSAWSKGLRAILRNDIILIHQEVTTKGSITYTQYENLKDMYEAYQELGGNGVITKLMKEMAELPSESIKRDS